MAQLKQEIRKVALEARKSLSEEQKQHYSDAVCDNLNQLAEERGVKVIHTFLPMGDEINILPFVERMLNQGKLIVTTKSLKNRMLQHLVLHDVHDLAEGIYGTKHPAKEEPYKGDYEMIVVPGLMFDFNGGRIGYGAGYYDTFLSEHKRALKVAVGYPFQKTANILPMEPHDVAMDIILVGEQVHYI